MVLQLCVALLSMMLHLSIDIFENRALNQTLGKIVGCIGVLGTVSLVIISLRAAIAGESKTADRIICAL